MGYALKVMVEMEDLTAGGLCMGLGMETTCHRYGLIQETVVAYEIVTADGALLRVTRESDPELFVGAFPEVWDEVRLQPELRAATARADEREVSTDPPNYRVISPDTSATGSRCILGPIHAKSPHDA